VAKKGKKMKVVTMMMELRRKLNPRPKQHPRTRVTAKEEMTPRKAKNRIRIEQASGSALLN
jgi:hypothetical protein